MDFGKAILRPGCGSIRPGHMRWGWLFSESGAWLSVGLNPTNQPSFKPYLPHNLSRRSSASSRHIKANIIKVLGWIRSFYNSKRARSAKVRAISLVICLAARCRFIRSKHSHLPQHAGLVCCLPRRHCPRSGPHWPPTRSTSFARPPRSSTRRACPSWVTWTQSGSKMILALARSDLRRLAANGKR